MLLRGIFACEKPDSRDRSIACALLSGSFRKSSNREASERKMMRRDEFIKLLLIPPAQRS
jgi:hypothetical protein